MLGLLWCVLSRPMLSGRQEALGNEWVPGVLSSLKLPGLLHAACVHSQSCCYSEEENMAIAFLLRNHYVLQFNNGTRDEAEVWVMHPYKASVSRRLTGSLK